MYAALASRYLPSIRSKKSKRRIILLQENAKMLLCVASNRSRWVLMNSANLFMARASSARTSAGLGGRHLDARLTHVECLGFARARWLRADIDDETVVKKVEEHFFAPGLT